MNLLYYGDNFDILRQHVRDASPRRSSLVCETAEERGTSTWTREHILSRTRLGMLVGYARVSTSDQNLDSQSGSRHQTDKSTRQRRCTGLTAFPPARREEES